MPKDSVLFKKDSGESHEEIWDDTALIKAYDRSVKNINEKLNSKLVIDTRETEKTSLIEQADEEFDGDEDEYEDKEDENISGNYEITGRLWKILDLCSAVYSEDGLLYPAKIQEIYGDDSMDYSERKCRIQYLDYLNEEDKYLNELYEYNEEDYAVGNNEEQATESKTNETKTTSVKAPTNTFLSGLQIPPPPPPPMLSSLINKSSTAEGKASLDDDALYSMLMSWYMSGYHTGYYFGKNSQK